MKITEKQIRNIIRESLNEISWQAATQAAGKSQDNIGERRNVEDCLDNLDTAIKNIMDILRGYSNMGWHAKGEMHLVSQANQLSHELENIFDKTKAFLNRKFNQAVNLSNMANNKFKDAHNGVEYNDYAETNDGYDDEFWDNYDKSKFSSRKY